VNEAALRQILDDVRTGAVDADEAVRRLRHWPVTDVGVAKVDHHRAVRQGMPEAVYGPGKTPEACVTVVGELLGAGASPVLLTRADADQTRAVLAAHPEGTVGDNVIVWNPSDTTGSTVAVVTAGTADAPVADECAAVLAASGVAARRINDVGVAGLHRLLAEVESLQAADVVVVVAGMEGALASVVTGLVAAPVIAVPTSVGYGAGLEGITALLGMLASCAAGLTVVGIDNGYGAACAAIRALAVTREAVDG